MPRFRPRISLLSALLLMTIVGMAIVVAQFWREVGPIRKELHRLRDEVGELSIEDDSNVHAIEVRTDDPLLWKWRVWIPEGQTVHVRSQWGKVPRIGVPQGNNAIALDPGEQWITLQALRNPSGASWNARVETATGSNSMMIHEAERWWESPKQAVVGEGVGFATEAAKDEEDVFILKRWRIAPVNNASDILKMESPTAGFIIWLERR